ncbi:hypothetical protein [Marinifilum fragile]|uniref:hypothetical protein n=1 Tax=Marinifilum fragile TaxID=570161 RepID=UPI002AA895B0|nr:hypothetical protein [Marinifilum fragile]
MKTKKLYYFLVAVFALSISMTACSGDDGDIGPDGPEGKQGIQGEVGPAGADGSVIYSGEGNPLDETGVTGDYYLDSTTGMIYGPKKNDDSWNEVDSFSLKGANGQDGQNGSKILSGYDTPSNSIGNIGDYYLDKETYTLFGPKLDVPTFGVSAWGTGLMLKGADGNANVRTFKYIVSYEDWTEVRNTSGEGSKYIYKDLQFPALSNDVYENGIVLVYWQSGPDLHPLPKSYLTSKSNLLTRGFLLRKSGSNIYLRFRERLEAYNDNTEVLATNSRPYQIKIITGQAAVQLSAMKNNPEKLYLEAERMGLAN